MPPHNVIRQFALPGFELPDLVRNSLDFLHKHEPPEGYFVGFSGGKDSIVTLELVRRSGVKYHAGYNVTGIDYPEIPRFIRKYYPEVLFLYPKQSYWSYFRKAGPPRRTNRWCCQLLKETNNSEKNNILGLRSEESRARAARGQIDTHKGKITYKPIFYWPEWAVWQFIEENCLPYPSLYDTGEHRIGCIGCPFSVCGPGKTKAIRREKEMAMFPHWYKIHKKISREWFYAREQKSSDKYKIHDFEIFYHNYWLI